MTPAHVFHSALILDGKPIGQLAYEAFVAARDREPFWSGPSPGWDDLVSTRQQTWDDMANAVLEAALPF